MQLANEQDNLPLASTLEMNIDLFKAGRPLRDTAPPDPNR